MKQLSSVVASALFVLGTASAFAQSNSPQQPQPGAAPAAEAAPAGQPAATAAPQEGPANLCEELLAFMKAPPPQPAPAAAPKKPSPLPDMTAAELAAAMAQQGGSQPASAQAGGAEPDGQSGSAQQATGQSGVATDSPAPGSQQSAGGSPENAPQKDSRSAPVPTDSEATPKELVMSVAEAEELAAANDMEACHDAAQKLRLAGVAMPPPLIALAALDLKFLQGTQP